MKLAGLVLIPGFFLAAIPASALDISGFIINKLNEPVIVARICLEGSTTKCVNSGVGGIFRLTDASPTFPGKGKPADFSLEFRRGRLSLFAPEAMRAKLEWFDAGGRRLSAAREVSLATGRNGLEMPTASGMGLRLLRLTAGGRAMIWKAVLLGSSAPGSNPERAMPTALSKAAALPLTLTVTKVGYRRKIYYPALEKETDVYIGLTAEGDSGYVVTRKDTTIVLTLDRDKKEITLLLTQWGCDSTGEVAWDSLPATVRYGLDGGKLYTWQDSMCAGLRYGGTGTDVAGIWNAEAMAELPASLKQPGCRVDSMLNRDRSAVSRHRLTITDTSFVDDVTYEGCPADFFIFFFIVQVWQDPAVTLVKNTCRHVIFGNGAGDTAGFTIVRSKDSLVETFTYQDTTCSYTEWFSGPMTPDCSNPPDAFLDCVANSGFSIPIPPPPGAGSAPAMASLPASLPMSMSPARAIPGAWSDSRNRWLRCLETNRAPGRIR